MRDLLIVRTHRGGAALEKAIAPLRNLMSLDLMVAADERSGTVAVPPGISKVVLDDAIVERMGLPALGNWGHHCGDYFLYKAREARPNYSRYWMIEPDVKINAADPEAFFSRFAGVQDDFIAPFFSERTSAWVHFAAMAAVRPRVFGCLFPLIRVSGTAINHLFQRRVALHRHRSGIGGNTSQGWPNDESFVATELHQAGFACSDINSHGREVCSNGFTWSEPIHHRSKVFAEPDGQAYHPVLQDGDFAARLIRKGLSAAKAGNAPNWLEIDLALAAVDWKARRGDGIAMGSDADRVLQMLLHASRTERLATAAGTAAERYLGAEGHRSPSHHAIIGRHREGWGISRPSDFICGPPIVADCFPVDRATAYAADFQARELDFACCMPGAPLLAEPFFYLAQHRYAASIARVSFDALPRIYPVDESADLRPVIVMSIGRCGSTLLSSLLGATGRTSISEPDVFSQVDGLAGQVAQNLGRPAHVANADASTVLRTAARSFACWAGVPPDRLIIKLRSQANRAVRQIVAAFPHAQFVFIYRDTQTWIRSFVEAFGHTAPMLISTLTAGIQACRALRATGVCVDIISYDQLIDDPVGTVRGICGSVAPLSAKDIATIEEILRRDSQAGTSISRANRRNSASSASQVEHTLADFHALWARRRPGLAIEELGLPY
jgi:hypothetical protein